MNSSRDFLSSATIEGVIRLEDWQSVILVEGESDRIALLNLARRLDLDLTRTGVVAMGGATNLASYLATYGPRGRDPRLSGLCDLGEVAVFARHLRRAGFDVTSDLEALESAGFFVCDTDLEDELIRAIGTDRVIEIIKSEGELGSLRRLQAQPAQRERTVEQHLHRFIGSRSGRKARYAALLVEALDLSRVPRPLDAVLLHATAP